MTSWLQINGVILIALACLHAIFPRHFRWRHELRAVSLLTRQILYVHTFFIALTVGLMGLLCLASAPDLVGTPLGRQICAGLFVFWLCRLLISSSATPRNSGAANDWRPPSTASFPFYGWI